MPDLQAAIEDFLAGLPEQEWRSLVARVRPPDEPETIHEGAQPKWAHP